MRSPFPGAPRAFALLLAVVFWGPALHAAEPLYGVSIVRAPSLWSVTTGRGVRVAIIDTGIDSTHSALQAAYRGGYAFVHADNTPDARAAAGPARTAAGPPLP